MQAKKDKGLCFRCDDKYTIGHRCRNKELHVLLVADDIEGGDGEEEMKEEKVRRTEFEEVELSMNSVVSLTSPKTMKMKDTINGQEVVVLIDFGATHNFISSKLVRKLKIAVTETNGYEVHVGSRMVVKGRGICKGVVLYMQTVVVIEKYLPLDLSNSDNG